MCLLQTPQTLLTQIHALPLCRHMHLLLIWILEVYLYTLVCSLVLAQQSIVSVVSTTDMYFTLIKRFQDLGGDTEMLSIDVPSVFILLHFTPVLTGTGCASVLTSTEMESAKAHIFPCFSSSCTRSTTTFSPGFSSSGSLHTHQPE